MHSVGQEQSDFQGPILHQLFIVPIALVLLLSLHKPFRDWVFATGDRLIIAAANFVQKTFSAADSRSLLVHGWAKSLNLLRRNRNFTLLLGVVILFEYAFSAFQMPAFAYFTNSPNGGFSDDPQIHLRFRLIMSMFYGIASGYFGWISWRMAVGDSFLRATNIRPILIFVLFGLLIAAADFGSQNLPSFRMLRYLISERETLSYVATYLGGGFLVALLAGGLLVALNSIRDFWSLLLSIAGFVGLGLLNIAFFDALTELRYAAGGNTIGTLGHKVIAELAQFIYTFIGSVIFIAFAASLAPETFTRTKTPYGNESD